MASEYTQAYITKSKTGKKTYLDLWDLNRYQAERTLNALLDAGVIYSYKITKSNEDFRE